MKQGIAYLGSSKLSLPAHNMNDILFANFFRASNFGNKDINDDGNCGTMFLYAGHKECAKIYSSKINVEGPNFSNGMAELKGQAEAQQKLGHHYMRVEAIRRNGWHAENIDINALLALGLNDMETGGAYPIGDSNWSGENMSGDIPRLAIRKVDDTPTYEFGTLDGSIFENIHMKSFEVYTPDIQEPPVES
jgi:hypothetical protein